MSQTSSMQTILARLQNLHSLFAHLTMEYYRLSPTIRKYLYGNDTMSTHDTRMMAHAKYILAATLQWKPSNHGYNERAFLAANGSREMKTGEGAGEDHDELSPVWIGFFKEMTEADAVLSAHKNDTTPAIAVSAFVEPLLRRAEDKYIWLNELATAVAQGGEFVPTPNGIQLTESMIFVGWNRFCFNTAKCGLEAALEGVRPVKGKGCPTTGAIHCGQSGQREYFAFFPAVAFQPWVHVLPVNDPAEHHPRCAVDSPCRRTPDFCPCKARGVECENWSCSRSGPWQWPCVPAEPQVIHTSLPSHGPAHICVEDARKAGELESGVVYGNAEVSLHPHPVSPNPILQTYNALWESLTPSNHQIVWPTPSFELRDLKAAAGLPLSEELLQTMPWNRLITLKVKAFFLSGFKIAYDVGEYPVQEAVVIPRFSTYDTDRMTALLRQMQIEQQRWSYESLSRRTGSAGYQNPTLGGGLLSWAVRDAIEELTECCYAGLRKAQREKSSASC